MATRPVLFVLLPNTLMLDLAGPAEVLRIASQLPASELPDGAPRFALGYVGPEATVATSIGLPLAGIAPLPEVLPADAVVVLVGVSSRVDDAARRAFDAASAHAIDWLRRIVGPSGAQLLCICSGALLAARAGLLDGRDCTTHHALCDALRLAAPRARVLENRLYVSDGAVSTSAGITAGIDMMLHLLAGWSGPRAACAVARNMVVYLRRGGADPQLSAWVSGRNHLHPALHRVQDALTADPVQPWSLDQMAQVACTSTRHLARLFHEHAGASPLDYLHRLRVAVARDLLVQSSLDMEAVAARAGFGSARHLRRVWRKFEEQAPSASRGAAVS